MGERTTAHLARGDRIPEEDSRVRLRHHNPRPRRSQGNRCVLGTQQGNRRPAREISIYSRTGVKHKTAVLRIFRVHGYRHNKSGRNANGTFGNAPAEYNAPPSRSHANLNSHNPRRPIGVGKKTIIPLWRI